MEAGRSWAPRGAIEKAFGENQREAVHGPEGIGDRLEDEGGERLRAEDNDVVQVGEDEDVLAE